LYQQTAEKYLKAILFERGTTPPHTHDLFKLLTMILPTDSGLSRFQRGIDKLSQYAVDYRYPGKTATPRQARAALRQTVFLRFELRCRLGLRARRPGR
jgi:HEPN domain-containing protein